MSKISPLYNSDKEKAELIAARDSFIFDEPRQAPRLILMISGPEGVGKTHLACTAIDNGPVYLIDTEYRADVVTTKFKDAENKPLVKLKVVRNWKELVVAVKAIIKSYPPGTIVIDSATDLQIFAEIEYLARTKQEKIYPQFNWTEVWAMCNALIDDIKFSQHGLIVTTRVKEQYLAEKSTGQFIPQVYKNFPHKADIGVQFGKDKKPGWVTKNGPTGNMDLQIPRQSTVNEIINLFLKS